MKNSIFFLIALLLSGCTVYHPMTTDIPLISEKKDLRIDAGISAFPSAHATVSYGLTDEIAIQGFGSVGVDVYYGQAAAGYFKNMGNNRIFEVYSGFGFGYGDAYRDANPGNLTGNYQLYFGQVNFGKIAGESQHFEAGIGIKTGYLHSNLTDMNYYAWVSDDGPFITYHDDSMLLEPLGTIKIGGDKLKFSILLGGTYIYKFTNRSKYIPYWHFNVGLGLNYRL